MNTQSNDEHNKNIDELLKNEYQEENKSNAKIMQSSCSGGGGSTTTVSPGCSDLPKENK